MRDTVSVMVSPELAAWLNRAKERCGERFEKADILDDNFLQHATEADSDPERSQRCSCGYPQGGSNQSHSERANLVQTPTED